MADQYILKVTAGPTYATASTDPVLINTPQPFTISTPSLDAIIHVRIKDYRGLPTTSPSTSPYFSHATHTWDRYSISFTFRPKRNFAGDDLVFGNDFDHPIRDRLPPGFSYAFGLVKRFVDPGLYGDPYAEEPYLYGPLLSSINVLHVGKKEEVKGEEDAKKVLGEAERRSGEEVGEGESKESVTKEGADEGEEKVRTELGVPDVGTQRQSHFLREGERQKWTWEEGRTYTCDFFNPYLDFNDFSLKLGGGWMPTYTLPIVKHWDGQPLRYVLKDRTTNTELFVLVFTLIPKERLSEKEVEKAEEGVGGKAGKEEVKEPKGSADDDVE